MLTGIVCWQGWEIKDLREQNVEQGAVIETIINQQKQTMEVDKEQTEAILILSQKVADKK